MMIWRKWLALGAAQRPSRGALLAIAARARHVTVGSVNDDAVAPRSLGRVKRRIGPRERLADRLTSLVYRNPETGTQALILGQRRVGELVESDADALGDVGRLLGRAAWQQQCEFLAPDAPRDMAAMVQQQGKAADNLVACLMPVQIVDPLEMVDVAKDHRAGPPVFGSHGIHHPPIEQPGQAVVLRLVLEGLD